MISPKNNGRRGGVEVGPIRQWVTSRDTEMFCLIESARAALGCLGKGWRVIFSNPVDRGLKTYMITQSSSVPETLLRQISAEGAVRLLYSFTPLTKSVPPVLQCYGLSQYKHLLSVH